MKRETYGLFTAITMIVGIVIGSGIYFRADDIFTFTRGNLLLGIFVMIFGSTSIIFGSLSFSYLSRKTTGSGGVINYFETFISHDLARGYGWFFGFIYLPSVSVVLGWASALYTFTLLGIEATLPMQIALGLFYNVFLIIVNSLSRKFGSVLQNISTVIKLIPLFAIVIYGFFYSAPLANSGNMINDFVQEFKTYTWLTALVPIAYSLDGWTIGLNIAPEVKNAKRNMPIALIVGPIIIIIAYITYLIGIYNILGPEKIISLGDQAIFVAGKQVLGDRLGNILLTIVVISVLGVLNGLCLASIRIPQALAEKKMIPDKWEISKIDKKLQISKKSVLIFLIAVIFWHLIHYLVMNYDVFNGRDISEISIVFNYLIYILLYKKSFEIIKSENKTITFIPIIAALGSIMMFIGSLLASFTYVTIFLLFSGSIVYLGYRYRENI